MKMGLLRILALIVCAASLASAREVVPLYAGTPPGSTPEDYAEKQYFSGSWNTEVVANVSKPSLTVFRPASDRRNGTAVIPDRVGIIGFSGGGTVAMGAALQCAPESRPAFVAPIYAAG